jgi:DNA-binding Lrp family transcriptional regulator
MFEIPKKPKIVEKVMQPDQRKFCVVPLRAVVAKDLTLTGLKVLCLLASYANKAGFTYVSQARMGNDLGVSLQAINRQIKQLETKGYIKQFSGYATSIKGKTKRIIYDESISDRDAVAISGETKEPFTNAEYNQILKERNMRKKKELQSKSQRDKVQESTQSDGEIIASLFASVSTERELLELERAIAQGESLESLKARYIKD